MDDELDEAALNDIELLVLEPAEDVDCDVEVVGLDVELDPEAAVEPDDVSDMELVD